MGANKTGYGRLESEYDQDDELGPVEILPHFLMKSYTGVGTNSVPDIDSFTMRMETPLDIPSTLVMAVGLDREGCVSMTEQGYGLTMQQSQSASLSEVPDIIPYGFGLSLFEFFSIHLFLFDLNPVSNKV